MSRWALWSEFIALLMIFALGNYIRFIHPAVVGFLTLVFIMAYTILRPETPYRKALALAGLALFYGFFSWVDVFPNSWTVYHEPGVMLRQLYGWAMLPIVAGLSYFWWQNVMENKIPRWWLWAVVAACVIGPLVMGVVLVALNVIPEPSFRLFRGLNNHSLAAFALFACFVFSLKPFKGFVVGVVMLALCMVFYGNAQNPILLTYLILLLVCRSFTPQWLKVGFLATISAIFIYYIYGWLNLIEIWDFDPNTAVRIVFIQNIFTVLADSFGLGVGFGTEAIRNFFTQIYTEFVDVNDTTINFVMIGPHNTFFEAFLRLGLIGGVLFTLLFAQLCHRVKNSENQALHYALCFACFISLWVNNTLLSPTEFFGFAFVMGLIKVLQNTDKPINQLLRWKTLHDGR